jgi:lipoprotein signal peptidase
VTEPSSVTDAKVNWLAIVALVIGAVSIFVNPYLLLSAIAIVLGIVALISARRAGNQRAYKLIAILAIVAGAIGAVLMIVSNMLSSSL